MTNKRASSSEFPIKIHIENTNQCNAHCIICPREKMYRKKGTMNLDLFNKIISESDNYKSGIKEIHLHGYGEPSLDQFLEEKIQLIGEYKFQKLYMVTNGSMLNKEVIQAIIRHINEIKISYYGDKSYSKIHRGLKQNEVDQNIQALFKKRNSSSNSQLRILIQIAPSLISKQELMEIFKKWNPFINEDLGDCFTVTGVHNWATNFDSSLLNNERVQSNVCQWPIEHMYITWDGEVLPCIFDINSVHKIGNINSSSIYDIWNCDQYDEFESHNMICKLCEVPIGKFKPVRITKSSLKKYLK